MGAHDKPTAAGITETERWTCEGLHPDTRTSVIWDTPHGRSVFKRWTGLSVVVGGLYDVNAERDGDRVTVYGTPQFTGGFADNRAALELQAQTWDDKRAAKELEKNAKRTSALDEAAAPLVALAANLTWSEREALMKFVSRKVMRA